jgi:hypothetical protein
MFDNLKVINQIIERDSKDTTYKFALLRSVIDAVQLNSNLKSVKDNRVYLPLGLLIDRWLLYFYPIIQSDIFIPQKNGEREDSLKQIAFRKKFKVITDYYKTRGGFSFFYNDFKRGNFHDEIKNDFRSLLKSIGETITIQPMKYLGTSYYRNHFSVFQYEKGSFRSNDLSLNGVIKSYGTFSLPMEFYEVFEYMGSFITGTNSILVQWAEWTARMGNGIIDKNFMIQKLLDFPVEEREVLIVKNYFDTLRKNNDGINCVWTDELIRDEVDIDHLLPFSVWKNNDLWNLLPVKRRINHNKRDKIPSGDLILKQADSIIHYWQMLKNNFNKKFVNDIEVGLLGFKQIEQNWERAAINNLIEKSNYLINIRGFEKWEP